VTARRATRAPSLEEEVLRAFKDFRAQVLRDPMRSTIKFLHTNNVSFGAIAALMALRERGDQSISHLSREIGLSLAATSQLVGRLVKDGLVLRTEHAEDRRSKHVRLAAKGEALLSRIDGSYFASAAQMLGRVPRPALRRLQSALEEVRQALGTGR